MADYPDCDAAYAEVPAYFGTDPEPLLVDHIDLIEPAGRVLDIGVGQGRNALPLAERGFAVVGVDASEAAIAATDAAAQRIGAHVDLWRGDTFDYEPAPRSFDAILCFGLIQVLPLQLIRRLILLVHDWLAPGGLFFVTGWHTGDPAYARLREEAQVAGRNSFRIASGELRTYLEPNEILGLLEGWHIVDHWEGLGSPHRHGEGSVEQHGDLHVVAQKL